MKVKKIPAWLLRQTITLYNRLPNNKIVNGGRAENYSRTVLRGVRYSQNEGVVLTALGGTVNDVLYVFIPPGVNADGKYYVAPDIYNSAYDGDRTDMWTLQKGTDYIALGEQESDTPSYDGKYNRNDFKISAVDILYNPDGSIHHFEVSAK